MRGGTVGGQGIERREILRFIGLASVASTFPGFSNWAFACGHDHTPNPVPQTSSEPYKPLFFTPQQFQMVEHLADMIIPEDETPGARKAGVAEFIDFMVANRVPVSGSRDVRSTQDAIEMGKEAQNRFLAGLNWMNAHSHSEFGHTFMECTSEQQNGLLEELAYKSKFTPTTESGRAFFQIVPGQFCQEAACFLDILLVRLLLQVILTPVLRDKAQTCAQSQYHECPTADSR